MITHIRRWPAPEQKNAKELFPQGQTNKSPYLILFQYTSIAPCSFEGCGPIPVNACSAPRQIAHAQGMLPGRSREQWRLGCFWGVSRGLNTTTCSGLEGVVIHCSWDPLLVYNK